MGVVMDGLWDHEGYGARRLPDGTLTATWTYTTREFTAFVAACGCGWRSTVAYPPTEEGEDLAIDHWELEHATPLVARQAERHQLELSRTLDWLGGQGGWLHDPAVADRVGRTLEQAGGLVAEVQRGLERQAKGPEASRER